MHRDRRPAGPRSRPYGRRRRRSSRLLAALITTVLAGSGLAAAGPGAQAAGTGAQAADTELAHNGGFEAGLDGWSCSAGSGSTVDSPVHGGSAALRAVPSAADHARCS
ncbi:hypothetical protein HOY81_05140 [Streptomyces sp. JJ36]|nr:hypothetical protein [Streptomyces sp. JJ36]